MSRDNRFFITFCGLLLTISAFSVDIVLPAFDLMAEALHSPVTRVQLSVPIYFIGYGIGQLAFGPASDAYGRMPVIYTALGIYLAGSVIALFSPDITGLLAGRALQGVGGGSVQVIARAMIRDRYSGDALARNMSLAMTIFSFGPIVAPLIGSIVIMNDQWQPVFIGMIVFGISLMIMGRFAPETHLNPDRSAIRPRRLLEATRTVVGNPQSRWFVVISGIATVMILTMVTNVPIIMEREFGIERMNFALLFAVIGIGIIFGQWLNRAMLKRIGPVRAALIGAIGCGSAFMLIFIFASMDLLQWWSLTALLFVFNFFYLTVYSNTIALSLDPHGSIAGLAASVTGFLASFIGATLSAAWTTLADGSIHIWSALVIVQSVICAIMLYYWRVKYR